MIAAAIAITMDGRRICSPNRARVPNMGAPEAIGAGKCPCVAWTQARAQPGKYPRDWGGIGTSAPVAGRVIFPAKRLGSGSASHQPDQQETKDRGHDAGHTQRSLRAFNGGGSQPLGGGGEGGKKQALDYKYETDGDKKLSHFR